MVPLLSSEDPRQARAKALRARVTVGIITALPKELAAVKAMLHDPVEDGFPGKAAAEYVLGEIPAKDGGIHTVAVVRVGVGQNLAAGRATLLLQHYPDIDALLMVGIAGGVPCPERVEDDVRLGDIVASDHRGVVQYDFIKETRTGDTVAIEHRHSPRPPSARLLRAVEDLEVAALEGERPWLPLLERERARKLPGSARPVEGEPRVFKGPVASANVLLKDADKRDALRDKFKVKAVEMEGSGVADAAWEHEVGYLVVRGICDHCDADKGDTWQMYAAVVAAAYACAVLGCTRSRGPHPQPPLPISGEGAPLPPNNLPPRRLFVGRERDLELLADALAHDGRASVTQAAASVHGLGGVGKTALALEYAHRHAREYPGGVWWLAAEGKPLDGLLKLAGILQAGAPPVMKARVDLGARSAESAVAAARMALQGHPEPSLLVLDNVDDRGWAACVPGGKTRVLVTTRDASLTLGKSASLGRLSRDEATALAEELAGAPTSEEEREARERILIGELDGLAVAVEMAARAVRAWALGWRAYEKHLRRGMEALLEDSSLYRDYPCGVFAALDLSIKQCPPGTPERALLEGAAVLAPDDVPIGWALEAAELDPEGLDAAKARARLGGLGLFEAGEDEAAVSLHRLVHRRVRDLAVKADEEAWAERCRRGADCVAGWLRKTVDPTRMAEVDQRRAHVDAALGAAERAGSERAWITIADRLARHLQHRAIYGEARAWREQALKRAEQLDPAEPTFVATMLSNLALVLKDLGLADEARPLLERSLAIDEKTYGKDHPSVATRLSNLALVLKDLGLADEARPLLERSLAIDEKTYGKDHPSVATRLSNLARVLQDLGLADEARPLLERSLAIGEKTYGKDHPSVAIGLSNLALVLQDLGLADEARPLLERSLAIVEKTYGKDHPSVATRLSNLALVLKDLGQADEARPLLERSLAIDEKTYGKDHPDVAIRLSNLAIVLKALGQADEARPLLERSLAIDEKTYGKDHPSVAIRLSNLALVLKALGLADEARPLLERSLAIGERRLPPGHPLRAAIAWRLASLDSSPTPSG